MIQCVFVGLGGFLGAVFRYLLGLIPLSAQLRIPVRHQWMVPQAKTYYSSQDEKYALNRQDTGPKS